MKGRALVWDSSTGQVSSSPREHQGSPVQAAPLWPSTQQNRQLARMGVLRSSVACGWNKEKGSCFSGFFHLRHLDAEVRNMGSRGLPHQRPQNVIYQNFSARTNDTATQGELLTMWNGLPPWIQALVFPSMGDPQQTMLYFPKPQFPHL